MRFLAYSYLIFCLGKSQYIYTFLFIQLSFFQKYQRSNWTNEVGPVGNGIGPLVHIPGFRIPFDTSSLFAPPSGISTTWNPPVERMFKGKFWYKGSLKKNSKKSDIVTIRSGTYLPYLNSDIQISDICSKTSYLPTPSNQ